MVSWLRSAIQSVAGVIGAMRSRFQARSAPPASPMRKRCSDTVRPSFKIAEDGKAITFSPCGLTSHNPNDVTHRFCALCGRFFE
jgi:hypothetical protein